MDSKLYKTKLCKHFLRNRVCPMGKTCNFAHGDKELRDISKIPCRFGDKCVYKDYKCGFDHTFFSPHTPPLESINDFKSSIECDEDKWSIVDPKLSWADMDEAEDRGDVIMGVIIPENKFEIFKQMAIKLGVIMSII
jgi:hypothetical protein